MEREHKEEKLFIRGGTGHVRRGEWVDRVGRWLG